MMLKTRMVLAALLLAAGGCTSTRDFTASGYALPANKPVSIIVLRPDVEVGSATAGGVAEPNAEWTSAARENLGAALIDNGRRAGLSVAMLPDQDGDAARTLADYEALHRSVASSIAAYKYAQVQLPTKRKRFDWTLGPGAAALGRMGQGGNYALFVVTRDHFATTGRVAMQIVFAALGGYVPAGQHLAYASLVDLQSGDVVWFNVLDGSAGDIRTREGAQAMVDRLMKSLPRKPGEGPRS